MIEAHVQKKYLMNTLLFFIAAGVTEYFLLNHVEDILIEWSHLNGWKGYWLLSVAPKMIFWAIVAGLQSYVLGFSNRWIVAGFSMLIGGYYFLETLLFLPWKATGFIGHMYIFGPFLCAVIGYFLSATFLSISRNNHRSLGSS